MTKREVRSIVLERLELHAATRFFDVGAGTGSVAIEAAIKNPNLHVVAIEKNQKAIDLMQQNFVKFDVSKQIRVVNDNAPCELTGKADAIFIGGSGEKLTEIIDWALSHLIPNGRLVLNFILQENFQSAIGYLKTLPISELECTQILVSQMTELGKGTFFKPNNPTIIVSCKKGATNGK